MSYGGVRKELTTLALLLGACVLTADRVAGDAPSGLRRGLPCNAAAECESGYCADGICCDSACDDADDRCDRRHYAGTCTTAAGVPVAPSVGPRIIEVDRSPSLFGMALGAMAFLGVVSLLVYRETSSGV